MEGKDEQGGKSVKDAMDAARGLGRGPHRSLRFLLAGPLTLDPKIQRLSNNLAFLTVTDAAGDACELIAKKNDGFLAPRDIDVLCTACSALDGAEVFPEVDTDSGERLYFHVVKAACLPWGQILPDPLHCETSQASQAGACPESRLHATSKAGSGTGTAARWGGANNDNRASVFVRWLLDTYSLQRLCSGVGVLDVAGGSGQVAWNLTCLRRCPSIVIDPRAAVANSKQRSYLRRTAADAEKRRGALFRPAVASVSPDSPDSTSIRADVGQEKSPRRVSSRRVSCSIERVSPSSPLTQMTQPIIDKQVEYKETTSCLSQPLPPIAKSFALAAEAAGVPYIGQMVPDQSGKENQPQEAGGGHEDGGPTENTGETGGLPLPRQLEQCFDSSFATAPQTRELWEKCSCVVGMHPDEATETILDLSLQHGKAFAIVPCCVFPEMNRHRRMPDGSPVRTWEQFLVYLQAKDEGIRRTNLPFPGRNVVLFHMGSGDGTTSCQQGLSRLDLC